jgi:hypothetical protein
MTLPDQPPVSSPGTIKTLASTSVPPGDESIESRAIFNRSHEITLADRQTPAGIEPQTPTRPTERPISAPLNREDSGTAEPQSFALDSDDPLTSRTTQQPSETAELAAQEPPRRTVVIEHAAHAMDETTSNARPVTVRQDIPPRLTPAAQPAPPRTARGQSRMQETQPPVEVKIGSVEIVFDQPPVRAAQPAPIRPAGFADFADLRRYAARPWSSRGR